MNTIAFVFLAGFASAQQFPLRGVLPAVKLATPGFFSRGQGLQNNEFQLNQGVFPAESLQLGLNDQIRFRSFGSDQLNDQFQLDLNSQSDNQGELRETSGEIFGQFEPLNLPAGATLILGDIDISFQCIDRPYGYYADQGNGCRVFHVCTPYLFSDGRIETFQYSFMCGEGQVFDQKELTCVEEFKALPCQEASNFYFRNEEFGLPEEKLLF